MPTEGGPHPPGLASDTPPGRSGLTPPQRARVEANRKEAGKGKKAWTARSLLDTANPEDAEPDFGELQELWEEEQHEHALREHTGQEPATLAANSCVGATTERTPSKVKERMAALRARIRAREHGRSG